MARLVALLVIGSTLLLSMGCASDRPAQVRVVEARAERRTSAPQGATAPPAAVGFRVRNDTDQVANSVLLTYDVQSAEPGRAKEWGGRSCYANATVRPGETVCLVADEVSWAQAVRVRSVAGRAERFTPPMPGPSDVPPDTPLDLRPTQMVYGWQEAVVVPSLEPDSLARFLTRDEPLLRREQYRFEDVPVQAAGRVRRGRPFALVRTVAPVASIDAP